MMEHQDLAVFQVMMELADLAVLMGTMVQVGQVEYLVLMEVQERVVVPHGGPLFLLLVNM
jgi:hypothetical protein